MTRTKGNVIVEEIKVGDIHYEFELGYCIKSEVISTPVRDEGGYWTWKSKKLSDGSTIEYGVREGMAHYAPCLYDNEAIHKP